jgi:hypothetical protein
MSDGNQFGLKLEANNDDILPNDLREYAKWLLADPRTLEVWGLLGARLARVECVTNENQSLELDSGDWFLVRVSSLHESPQSTIGIVRFRKQSTN